MTGTDWRSIDDFERRLMDLTMQALCEDDFTRAATYAKAWNAYRASKSKPAPRKRKADDPNEARGVLNDHLAWCASMSADKPGQACDCAKVQA